MFRFVMHNRLITPSPPSIPGPYTLFPVFSLHSNPLPTCPPCILSPLLPSPPPPPPQDLWQHELRLPCTGMYPSTSPFIFSCLSPFIFSCLFTLCKMQENITEKRTHWTWGFSSPLVCASPMQATFCQAMQIENIVWGDLELPMRGRLNYPTLAKFTLTWPSGVPLSIEWLCLLRAWCVSIARCLGLRRVCSWSFFLARLNPVDRSSPQATFCHTR